jgi:hypothetical protein
MNVTEGFFLFYKYSSSNILRIIKLRRRRRKWTGHVAHMEEA